MGQRLMKWRDLFAMRAHLGWCHVLLGRVRERLWSEHCGPARVIDRVMERMERSTQISSARFDARHGTETFQRLEVYVSEHADPACVWGYAAINQDFFVEIIRAIPGPLPPYAFVDVGSGKGAAVLMASDFPFRRLVGIELTPELVEIARCNVDRFNASTGRQLDPEWIRGDYFKWAIPNEPQLFFFNNPFPDAITLPAIKALESSLQEHPRPVLLVFRKAPKSTGDHLHRSSMWRPLRLAPYWRIYAAGPALANG